MKIAEHDTDERVLIVAEVGNNHEGDVELAAQMVRLAAEAGADVVKFQTFRTPDYIGPGNPERTARIEGYELTRDDFRRLADLAREVGVTFLSTPFDPESARFLAGLAPALKIASGDNTFFPLLETAAGTGLPLIVSTGLTDLDQVRYIKAFIEDVWRREGTEQELALLHCVCAYPVPDEDANLGAIRTLIDEIGGTVGYSDHTLGIEAAVLSVAAGARIVEKHFTIDHQHSDFRDHQLSANPEQMAELVVRIRAAEELMGDGVKKLRPAEMSLLEPVRRSVAANRDLAAGVILGPDDLTWVRPAGGIPPGREALALGRRLKRPLARGEAITLDALEGGDG